MAKLPPDQEFVTHVVKQLVDNPDDVELDRKVDEMGVLLTLKVNPEDMGTIIGRQGSTAKAIRTLLRIVGAKNNARVNLKLEEPEGSTRVRAPREDYKSRPREMSKPTDSDTAETADKAIEKDVKDVVDELEL
ncbi:MAG: hypothetical protein UY09_C0037G0007 [Parcubacteria group bacterium GW2011_GWA2_47_8]|nr:MAG: hypothetical protein UY09_C0037G0007 [Parcubacteria group bacterium GW2011_GWA2_47_8]OHB19009.1 MAG: hypothetical protein A2666_02155 [Parcubacteria group bacterium RIFCSPHIGHO2_01_FULL_47_10b]